VFDAAGGAHPAMASVRHGFAAAAGFLAAAALLAALFTRFGTRTVVPAPGRDEPLGL
jgi:hypothetical protein